MGYLMFIIYMNGISCCVGIDKCLNVIHLVMLYNIITLVLAK